MERMMMTFNQKLPARLKIAALAIAFMAIAGCAASGGFGERTTAGADRLNSGVAAGTTPESDEIKIGNGESDTAGGDITNNETYPGTGVFIDEEVASRPRPEPMAEDGVVTLNFEATPLQEVVHMVLGDLLGENFVIGPGVAGAVTFATAKPIKRNQILPILEMLLRWNGATLVYTDERYHVLRYENAIPGNLAPRMGSVESMLGFEVRVVPLEYIAASEMQKLLEPYARQGAILSADNARGLIFLSGTRTEMQNYLQTIETFDVNWLDGMSVGLFPLQRVEVATVVPELEEVFGQGADSPLSGMFRFLPLERLNSVMVITPQPKYLEEAREWVERLDRSGSEAGSRLYVYQVLNLEAAELAGYLTSVFGGTATGTSRRSGSGSVAPGLNPVGLNSFNEQSQAQANTAQRPAQRPASGSAEGVGVAEGGEIRITAVEQSNSLLIQASASQYEAMLAAIKRLDVEPLQVQVEVQVLEVVLNDQLEFGVNYFLSNESPAANDFISGLLAGGGFVDSNANNYSQFGADPNFFTSFARNPNSGNFLAVTINALDAVSDVRVLSTPSLVVRNNEEANINVGESLAVQTTNFNPSGSATGSIQSNQYIRTGVQLSVTPRVNPGGLVYLDVNQVVSSPSGTAGASSNPNINERSLTTKIAVQSGNTVLLGGLIRNIDTRATTGLPGISRIPIIGGLFGKKSRTTQRTELLMLISPTVVQSVETLNAVTDEYQSKFKVIQPLGSRDRLPLIQSTKK
jgi:general secretion pathway protein D